MDDSTGAFHLATPSQGVLARSATPPWLLRRSPHPAAYAAHLAVRPPFAVPTLREVLGQFLGIRSPNDLKALFIVVFFDFKTHNNKKKTKHPLKGRF